MKTKTSFILSNALLGLAFVLIFIVSALPNACSLERGMLGFDSVDCIFWDILSILLLMLVIGGISLMKIPLYLKKETFKKSQVYRITYLFVAILIGSVMLFSKGESFLSIISVFLVMGALCGALILFDDFFLLDVVHFFNNSPKRTLLKYVQEFLPLFAFGIVLFMLITNFVVLNVNLDGKLHILFTILSALMPLTIAGFIFCIFLLVKGYNLNPKLKSLNLNLEKKVFNYVGIISLTICLGILSFNVSSILWRGLYLVSALFFLEIGKRQVKKFILKKEKEFVEAQELKN